MGNVSDRYKDGVYFEATGGTWHLEDSEFKAEQIFSILNRHSYIEPKTVCEIGCGAGGIIVEMQKRMGKDKEFIGYDISPQAHSISKGFENAKLQFVLGDAFEDKRKFDLVLAMDVVEHVEDCFGFVRLLGEKGVWKIYHFPLIHASGIIRGVEAHSWDDVGHIHLFTAGTALRTVSSSGQEIVDYMLTEGAFKKGRKRFRTTVANIPRYLLSVVSKEMASRLLGGFSLLVLAR